MVEATISRIDEALDKPIDELEDELPALLEEIDGNTQELLETNPAVFVEVVDRVDEVDVAEFVSDNPETAERFQGILWTGAELFVDQNPDVLEQVPSDVAINFEANDCPLEGHIAIDTETRKLTGAPGTVDEAELTLIGPADTLVGIITGDVDPVQGFMGGEFDLDGDVSRGAQLAQIFQQMTDDGYQSLIEDLDE